MKIIKGDKVQITIGKDKNRQGDVIRVIPKKAQVVVKSLNMFKKHIKPSTNQKKGGIIEKERPILASKVALICPNCKKTTRVGYQIEKSGDKVRICRKCKTIISQPLKK
jgi:large subunit ribosomal protein L24